MDTNFAIATASAIKDMQLQNQVSMAMAQKTQQVQKQQGSAVVSMIQQSAELSSQLSQGRIDVQL